MLEDAASRDSFLISVCLLSLVQPSRYRVNGGSHMSCARCKGLMVKMNIEDAQGSTNSFSAWHCLLCGNVTDAGIRANRRYHQEPLKNRARPHGVTDPS